MGPGLSRRSLMITTAVGGTALALPVPVAAASGARGRAGESGQLAFLNHTYTSFDPMTADAVATSAYLREFGAFQLRTTTNGEITYSGRYLLGRETYLEMFAEGELPGPDGQRGATGLAHSPDRAGTIDAVKQRMIKLGAADPLDVVQSKQVDGEQIPWFRVVAPTSTYQASFPWVMEYLESYFADPRVHAEPASYPGDVSRERYDPDDYKTKLMRDVVGVEFGAPAADLSSIATTLRASGLRVRSRTSGLVAAGRSELIKVEAGSGAGLGWRRIVFALNCEVRRRHTEKIGASRLVVGPGRHAVWTFG